LLLRAVALSRRFALGLLRGDPLRGRVAPLPERGRGERQRGDQRDADHRGEPPRIRQPARLRLVSLAPPRLGLGALGLFLRAARREIRAILRVELRGDVGARVERLRLGEPGTLMGEPGVGARIRRPVPTTRR